MMSHMTLCDLPSHYLSDYCFFPLPFDPHGQTSPLAVSTHITHVIVKECSIYTSTGSPKKFPLGSAQMSLPQGKIIEHLY